MIETRKPETLRGISRELSLARSQNILRLKYALWLQIPATPDETVRGRVCIDLTLADGCNWPVLDFAPATDRGSAKSAVHKLTVNGACTGFECPEGHILLTSRPEPSRHHRIEIDFEVRQRNFKRRDHLIYTLFVPAKAHQVFPCFDQPDLKAPLQLELEIPSDWDAIANAPEIERTNLAGSKRIRFAKTEPLPTYLYAFAAGLLHRVEATVDGRQLEMLHTASDTDAIAANRDEVFRLHAEALDFLEDYTGISQPFAKFAFVLIPDFEFSGMEHPGCIFYCQSLILLDATATESNILRRANLIAHETAHLWFGDLVTMRWFGDVWLKEVFANFMADKILSRLFPDVDHELGFLLRHFPPAYAIDRTAGTHAIRRSLDNLSEAAELYDALIYHKAPIAMAELEREIGEPIMRRGTQTYLSDFRFASADWSELRSRLEQAGENSLADWSRRWIESPGKPALDEPRAGGHRPEYGARELGPACTAKLLGALETPAQPIERAGAWLTLYEDMLDGGVEPARLLTAAIAALESEANDLLISRLIADLAEIYWRFLTKAQREFAASQLEPMLQRRLRDSAHGSHGTGKGARWIETLALFVITPASITELEALWLGGVPGHRALPESLAAKLAIRLALLKPDCSSDILERQIGATTDCDRRAMLEFVAPALAARHETRNELFGRLIAGEGRGTWAVSAARLLNHALRADESLDYLEPGIEYAAALHRRGEIFLPRRWLTALFSGHGTAAAADRIRAVIGSAEYAPGFRSLILETADPVLRAAAIRERPASR